MRFFLCFLIAQFTVVAFAEVPLRADALKLPDGRTKMCMLPNGVLVQELTVPGPVGGFAGFTTVTPAGASTTWNLAQLNNLANMAVVLAGSTFHTSDPQVLLRAQTLVIEQLAFHECAHARLPTANEFAANAESIEQMQALGEITPADLQWIGTFTQSLGPQPPQYGGSGAAFWAGTIQLMNASPGPHATLDSRPI